MGTASTMALITETLGLMVPGGACARLYRRIAAVLPKPLGIWRLIWPLDNAPLVIFVCGSFENAMRVLLAVGGSTNAIVHLAAMAGRMGIALDLTGLMRLAVTHR